MLNVKTRIMLDPCLDVLTWKSSKSSRAIQRVMLLMLACVVQAKSRIFETVWNRAALVWFLFIFFFFPSFILRRDRRWGEKTKKKDDRAPTTGLQQWPPAGLTCVHHCELWPSPFPSLSPFSLVLLPFLSSLCRLPPSKSFFLLLTIVFSSFVVLWIHHLQ
jgi:hypothetical protein